MLPSAYDNIATAATTHDPSKPIYMLNLWRFRPNAIYPPSHAHLSLGPCTGVEAVSRYRAALKPLIPANASVQFAGKVLAGLVIPEGEKWDFMALVRYETLQGFRDMVESREYKEEVEGHKLAGLEDQRLVMMAMDESV